MFIDNIISIVEKKAAQKAVKETRKRYKALLKEEIKRNLSVGAQKAIPRYMEQYKESCELIRLLNLAIKECENINMEMMIN